MSTTDTGHSSPPRPEWRPSPPRRPDLRYTQAQRRIHLFDPLRSLDAGWAELLHGTRLLTGLTLVLGATSIQAQEITAPLPPPKIDDTHNREALGVGRPVNRCAAVYPQREFYRAQEGWVIVEFSVTAGGDVENAKVIVSSPPDIFDASALEGIAACRFEPKVVEGEPVAVEGVRERVVFLIED